MGLVFLAACGIPQDGDRSIDLGAFDQAAVERRHPALAGKIITGHEADQRYADLKRIPRGPERWVDVPEETLRAGTVVRIRAEGQEITFTVPPQGQEVDAVFGARVAPEGKTVAQVRSELNQKLSRQLRFPQAQVEVREDSLPRSNSRRFAVAGMVKKPGDYRADVHPTVRFGVSRAGGALDGALPNQVLVVRPSGETLETVIVVDMLTCIEQRNVRLLSDPLLRDGDIIVVPRNFDASRDTAAEWEPIGEFAAGRIDRRTLLERLGVRYDRSR